MKPVGMFDWIRSLYEPRRRADMNLVPAGPYKVSYRIYYRKYGTCYTQLCKIAIRDGFEYEEPLLGGYKLFVFRQSGEDRGGWQVVDPASGYWPYKQRPRGRTEATAILAAKASILKAGRNDFWEGITKQVFRKHGGL